MRTLLLVGSGVSIHSDIPCISSITEEILLPKSYGKKCQELIGLVKTDIDNFYKHLGKEHITNYEDIYYVLSQIVDSYRLEYENPAVFKLVEFLMPEIEMGKNKFEDCTRNSIGFIENLVSKLINIEFLKFNQFDIIKDIIKNFQLEAIHSLNHDLVLEKWFASNQIKYDDGFNLKKSKLPEWVGFKKDKSLIKLCKLHGSVGWFGCYITKPSSSYNRILKLPLGIGVEEISSIDKSIITNTDRPVLLVGTFNKMLSYLNGIFEELYEEFKTSLSNAELIIISGYGFGDKGINMPLTKWLNQDYSKKMIIIHPNKSDLCKNARGQFINDIMGHQKVKWIDEKFEDINIKQIKEMVFEQTDAEISSA